MRRRPAAALIAALAALLIARTASAQPGLLLGFSDDAVKWKPAASLQAAGPLGARLFRVTLAWAPGETTIGVQDAIAVNKMLGALGGARVVVSLYGPSS